MGAPAGGIERYFKRFLYRDQSGRLDCLPLISKIRKRPAKLCCLLADDEPVNER